MSKIRINDLARELEVKSKEILDVLTTVGVTEKKTHSSSLEDHEADLVRKHLRGRSDAAPSSARPSSRAAHGEDEIKTKIDLSHISRPGDVLRAITQQKGAAEHPAARPGGQARRFADSQLVEAKAEAPVRSTQTPKAVPPKPATEAPCACGAETGDAGFGRCRVPAADSGGDSAQSSRASTRRDSAIRLSAQVRVSTAGDRRSASSDDSGSCRPAGSAPPVAQPPALITLCRCKPSAPAKAAAPIAPPPRMIMPQTGPRPVYKAPLPPPGARARVPAPAPRRPPGRPVPGQPIFQRTAPAAGAGCPASAASSRGTAAHASDARGTRGSASAGCRTGSGTAAAGTLASRSASGRVRRAGRDSAMFREG